MTVAAEQYVEDPVTRMALAVAATNAMWLLMCWPMMGAVPLASYTWGYPRGSKST